MTKIDIVIAWVDGSDPLLAKKRRSFQQQAKDVHSDAVVETRFADRGEIYYCIASVLRYAPFANRIWIISDAQRPRYLDAFFRAGLCDQDFIQVVDHSTVFRGFEDFLPTFSAKSIETVMWRIPGLSEHFVYLNDDFFFNSRLSPEFLFREGKPVLRGRRTRPRTARLGNKFRRFFGAADPQKSSDPPSFRVGQELAWNPAGPRAKYLRIGHHPHPLRRSTFEQFYSGHPDILTQQFKNRFRSSVHYAPVTLANNLEMAMHGVKAGPAVKVAYANTKSDLPKKEIIDQIRGDLVPYGCIQSMDQRGPEAAGLLHRIMVEKFGKFLPRTIPFEQPA